MHAIRLCVIGHDGHDDEFADGLLHMHLERAVAERLDALHAEDAHVVTHPAQTIDALVHRGAAGLLRNDVWRVPRLEACGNTVTPVKE